MEIKPEIKFGALGAILLISWTLIQYYLGFHSHNLQFEFLSGYVNSLIVFIMLYIGIREKRVDWGNKFTLRKGMKSGMYQLVLTATLASLQLIVPRTLGKRSSRPFVIMKRALLPSLLG